MSENPGGRGVRRVLVLGGTGTIGREVLALLAERGVAARTLTRDPERARTVLGPEAEIVRGDLTRVEDLRAAADGADAIVMTHGAPYGSGDYEEIDYGAVPRLLAALDGRTVPVALMSSIGASRALRSGPTGLLAWKRDGERVLRASGLPHLVVRPGWFDAAGPGEERAVLLQGDARDSGGVRRRDVAEALVQGLLGGQGLGRTVEVFSGSGRPLTESEWDEAFAALPPDAVEDARGARDPELPEPDPESVAADLSRVRGAFRP